MSDIERDLQALYKAAIMDHARAPKNVGAFADATHHAKGHNPLCGDHVTLTLRCDGDHITAAAHDGAGCALSTASASMLTEAIADTSIDDAQALAHAVRAMLASPATTELPAAVGALSVLAAARAFPARIKCVTLAWETLAAALAAR